LRLPWAFNVDAIIQRNLRRLAMQFSKDSNSRFSRQAHSIQATSALIIARLLKIQDYSFSI
jgi:hypothetical protein